ncbi:undecaprenyldiphospho-muramoylpentapeptide beta-N-acetylglucosaminyltransferase [Persicirhabdus sediminis]|uniref:UDP-N-acetylglucosamine--N-acetylmuramyl-(pentapeptide) pyrophosphoryl-undecaprenol N-acetylglucosamine transferase n=1 Tax=Persicirhabdus sediminis TaxID=454144 RepID=A0A8J7ME72_9BACT|nr:undecaprenyldiphospho-muramoylpentapeptide beta-N-acetylglucosaminyltransferase [Persicirhabdus sediminis]MBK1791732.1 undecaprenyldiphospho-muramoylpentapeptide beta-N-acetylglucosaminyltransferase [Persicirhabdus sediminis]
MPSSLNVVIACGGTGGHLFPGIAVAEEMRRRGHTVTLLISEKKVDAQASSKYGDLDFRTIPAIAKPATFSIKMVPFMAKMWQTIGQCKKILKELNADAVLGMGGFTSLAPVYAAHKLGLKSFVHDSNALPGKANRLTSRWCNAVFLGLEEASSYFPNSKVVITGTPVRSELTKLPSRDDAAAKWKLNPELKTILVMGGSQGAKQLNTVVATTASAMPDVQFLHLTGNRDFDRVNELAAAHPNHHVVSFCDDMPSAYAASDLTICRSGASSLSEISYLEMASILVPYPYAADDHQTKNAEVFADAGAALLRQEADLDSGSLLADLTQILFESNQLAEMAEKSASIAIKDAASQICGAIESA